MTTLRCRHGTPSKDECPMCIVENFQLTADSPFDESVRRLAEKRIETVMRHRERYITAYCARFGISVDDFDKYEVVTREEWRGTVLGTSVFMRKRVSR